MHTLGYWSPYFIYEARQNRLRRRRRRCRRQHLELVECESGGRESDKTSVGVCVQAALLAFVFAARGKSRDPVDA